jgi:hypothetical protein
LLNRFLNISPNETVLHHFFAFPETPWRIARCPYYICTLSLLHPCKGLISYSRVNTRKRCCC